MACTYGQGLDGGVILGADSRTSTGSYVANRASDKITQLTDKVTFPKIPVLPLLVHGNFKPSSNRLWQWILLDLSLRFHSGESTSSITMKFVLFIEDLLYSVAFSTFKVRRLTSVVRNLKGNLDQIQIMTPFCLKMDWGQGENILSLNCLSGYWHDNFGYWLLHTWFEKCSFKLYTFLLQIGAWNLHFRKVKANSKVFKTLFMLMTMSLGLNEKSFL